MKRTNSILIILLVSIACIPFCSRKNSISERIIGKWKMTKVLELTEDVTEKHNPDNNRWIRFINDPETENGGTFESGSGDKTENTGKWFINKDELFIDSDAGEEDDSYWQIKIDEDEMYWKGKRFDFNKRFEIFHERIE